MHACCPSTLTAGNPALVEAHGSTTRNFDCWKVSDSDVARCHVVYAYAYALKTVRVTPKSSVVQNSEHVMVMLR